MHSHHSHSGQFCRHAAPGTTLEQSVLVAIERGLTTLGLSEHVPRYRPQDLYPEESDLSPDDLERIFDEFLQEAHRLKKTYQGRIDLLVGGETDYITSLDLERLEALLEREEGIEYLVGSVHHVEQHPIDFSEPLWRECVASFEPNSTSSDVNATPSDAARTSYFTTYLDAQYTLLTRLAPPIIGHFDLCRLYIPSARLNDARRFPGVWDRAVRNIHHVIAYGGLFEVNAAAFRKGWATAYPGREILRCIIASGGRLCLSDDSHGPHGITQNYLRMRDYLVAEGVREIWYLASVPQDSSPSADGGRPEEEGITNPSGLLWSWLDPVRRRVVARRYEGDWAEDGFWDALKARETQEAVGK